MRLFENMESFGSRKAANIMRSQVNSFVVDENFHFDLHIWVENVCC